VPLRPQLENSLHQEVVDVIQHLLRLLIFGVDIDDIVEELKPLLDLVVEQHIINNHNFEKQLNHGEGLEVVGDACDFSIFKKILQNTRSISNHQVVYDLAYVP
jgi:hypothetical protein